MDAYVRFPALEAAIVRIIRGGKGNERKIRSFLTVREKKVWKALPMLSARIRAPDKIANRIRQLQQNAAA